MATLVPYPQRSPEWLEARIGLPTASRFKDIVALTRSGYSTSRRNYAAELVIEQLTKRRQEGYTNAEMEWGTQYEPVARLMYELDTRNVVTETGLWLHDTIFCGASPDGFIGDDGTIEIKCPKTITHLSTLESNQVPYIYRPQVQGQLWITERQWCDFVSYDPRLPANAQLKIIRVPRDDEYIAKLEQEIISFLGEVDEMIEFVLNYGKGT